jgi:hypothetical protein
MENLIKYTLLLAADLVILGCIRQRIRAMGIRDKPIAALICQIRYARPISFQPSCRLEGHSIINIAIRYCRNS